MPTLAELAKQLVLPHSSETAMCRCGLPWNKHEPDQKWGHPVVDGRCKFFVEVST